MTQIFRHLTSNIFFTGRFLGAIAVLALDFCFKYMYFLALDIKYGIGNIRKALCGLFPGLL